MNETMTNPVPHKYRYTCDCCGKPTDIMYQSDPVYPNELPVQHHRCVKHFRRDVTNLIGHYFHEERAHDLLEEGLVPDFMFSTEAITIQVMKAISYDHDYDPKIFPCSSENVTMVAIASNNYTGSIKAFTFSGILSVSLLQNRIGHIINQCFPKSIPARDI